LPFSGKSTVARQIARLRNATVISLDEINESRGLKGAGEGLISTENWEQTHAIAIERLLEATAREIDIVVDDTNCFRFLRDNYRAHAEKSNYHAIVVVTATPLPEIRERMGKNNLTKERHGVANHVLDEVARRFEWPTKDEKWVTSSTLLDELSDAGSKIL
jgi:tRNA uridine 5-carbamoylmethylation protein Kti12